MVAEPTKITVVAETVFNGTGRRIPFSVLYSCTGPDGRQFDNLSLKTLRERLRLRYGKVVVEIDDQTDHRQPGMPRPAGLPKPKPTKNCLDRSLT